MDAGHDNAGGWSLSVGEAGSDGIAEISVEVRLKPVPRKLTLFHIETRNFVEASSTVTLNGVPVPELSASSLRREATEGPYQYGLRIRGRVREEALRGAGEQSAAILAMTYMLDGDESPTRLAFSGNGVSLSGMKRETEGSRSGGCDAGLGWLALAVFVVFLRTQCSISRNEIDGQHRL